MAATLGEHFHGKNNVHVLKVVRGSSRHDVLEYTMTVKIWASKYSVHYTDGDNTDLIATDTIRNTTYIVAKTHDYDSPEEFAANLCNFFLDKYSFVDRVWVRAEEKQWKRVKVDGRAHNHGFVQATPELNVATCNAVRGNSLVVESQLLNMIVLKTTQTGFAGFLHNEHTTLPDVDDRLLSTNVTATWTYVRPGAVSGANGIRAKVRRALVDTFYGPADTGVYSKSVQETCFKMGTEVCKRVPDVATITLNMPNIHYIPFHKLKALGHSFDDDIYEPTTAPAGNIQATIVQAGHSRSKL